MKTFLLESMLGAIATLLGADANAREANRVKTVWANRLALNYGSVWNTYIDDSGSVFAVAYTGHKFVLAKFGVDGTVKWNRQLAYYYPPSTPVELDSRGNAFTVTWGSAATNYTQFVTSFSPEGEVLWKTPYQGTVAGVAVDRAGDVVVTGDKTIKYSGRGGSAV